MGKVLPFVRQRERIGQYWFLDCDYRGISFPQVKAAVVGLPLEHIAELEHIGERIHKDIFSLTHGSSKVDYSMLEGRLLDYVFGYGSQAYGSVELNVMGGRLNSALDYIDLLDGKIWGGTSKAEDLQYFLVENFLSRVSRGGMQISKKYKHLRQRFEQQYYGMKWAV